MKIRILHFIYALSASLAIAADILPIAQDGYPTGQSTPEGAATDFARAFINKDYSLFSSLCIPAYGGDEIRAKYQDFKDSIKKSMQEELARSTPSAGGPKEVGKVFVARRLSKNGPVSYGYAAFDFQDIQFVDVGVILHNGERHLNRTLVIKKDGKWFVHPVPSLSPLLSTGLNEESASTTGFGENTVEQDAAANP